MVTCRTHIDDHLLADERALAPCKLEGSAPAQATDDAHWWCMTFGPEPMGACVRSREKCERARDMVKRSYPSDKLSACAPQATASCTDVTNRDGHHLGCAPDARLCATVAEAQRMQPGAQTSVCHPVE